MESILVILCIVFFAVLTYGLIQGSNLTKDHLYDCRTIYIPEEIDLELAYESIRTNNLNYLKKKGRELGASKKFVDKFKEKTKDNPNPDYTDLKIFIVQNSVSDKHIAFTEVKDEIMKAYTGPDGKETTISLEEYNMRNRIDSELRPLIRSQLTVKAKSLRISEDPSMNDKELRKLIKSRMLQKVEGESGFKDPKVTIKELKKDAGIDDY